MQAKRYGILLASLALLQSCKVGPNYARPPINAPQVFRGNPTETTAGGDAKSFGDEKWWDVYGDEKWWDVYQDETLRGLLRKALEQNFDLRIAATRVLQAQAQLGITRSNQFPTISGGPGYQAQQVPVAGGFGYALNAITASGSWTIDFWGQYRRATEAARAALLATEYGHSAALSSLVANVASDYFALRELDLELEISNRTLKSRRDSLQLTETLSNGGSVSLLDVRQAEQLVETAAAAIPDLERQVGQLEDSLSTLLGENPHDVPRGRRLTEEPVLPSVPTGLPSGLLERRPDIQQAEQQLAAATAQIGVARAALFPQISLTGTGGSASTSLVGLYTAGGGGLWNLQAGLTQQIFNAGRLRYNVRLTEAQQQQALLSYQQTIERAFQQTSDALIAYNKYRTFREHQEALVKAAREASDLSHMRYQGGVTSYLEVLTNETNLYSAELTLARARLGERLSLVQLYYALGGGWQQ